jgi:hypothetical protein
LNAPQMIDCELRNCKTGTATARRTHMALLRGDAPGKPHCAAIHLEHTAGNPQCAAKSL